MSAAHRVLFCDDLLSQICVHATPLVLWNICMTAKAFSPVTRRVTTTIVRKGIRQFVADVDEFLKLLERVSGIVGGDVALDIALLNQPVRPLLSSVLSVFVPSGSAESMRGVFMGWGYGRIPLVGYSSPDKEMFTLTQSCRDRAALPRGSRSRTRLVCLSGPVPRRVDIIESSTVHAAYPIIFAKHTTLCNLISPGHFCVSYPRLTNHLRFRITKSRSAAAEGSTMEMRGLEKDGSPTVEGRRLFDRGCMILPFGVIDRKPDCGRWAEVGTLRI